MQCTCLQILKSILANKDGTSCVPVSVQTLFTSRTLGRYTIKLNFTSAELHLKPLHLHCHWGMRSFNKRLIPKLFGQNNAPYFPMEKKVQRNPESSKQRLETPANIMSTAENVITFDGENQGAKGSTLIHSAHL